MWSLKQSVYVTQNLKEIRESLDVSIKEIIRSLGVSAPNYVLWEAGTCYPSIDKLIMIEEFLSEKGYRPPLNLINGIPLVKTMDTLKHIVQTQPVEDFCKLTGLSKTFFHQVKKGTIPRVKTLIALEPILSGFVIKPKPIINVKTTTWNVKTMLYVIQNLEEILDDLYLSLDEFSLMTDIHTTRLDNIVCGSECTYKEAMNIKKGLLSLGYQNEDLDDSWLIDGWPVINKIILPNHFEKWDYKFHANETIQRISQLEKIISDEKRNNIS